MRRGDRLRRRRQLLVGVVTSVVAIGAVGLAIQLPGGDLPIPEVAGQDETESTATLEQEASELEAPREQPDELPQFASGRLDDGRTWTAQGEHTSDHLCLRFSVADRELFDNCLFGVGQMRSLHSFIDGPGGENVTIGFVGVDVRDPVEIEFDDGTTAEVDVHELEASPIRFFLAEHGDRNPTHLLHLDQEGEQQRAPLQGGPAAVLPDGEPFGERQPAPTS